jgi:hypothetical protein
LSGSRTSGSPAAHALGWSARKSTAEVCCYATIFVTELIGMIARSGTPFS